MSDIDPGPSAPRQTDRWLEPGPTNVQVIYILYLAGLVIGISGHCRHRSRLHQSRQGRWLRRDALYRLIRTFWIGLLCALISAALMLLGSASCCVGDRGLVHCSLLIGLQALGRNEPIKNPESWLI